MMMNVNALGGLMFSRHRQPGRIKSPQQSGLPGTALSENKQFGFEEVIDVSRVTLAEIVQDRFVAMPNDFGGGLTSGQPFTVTPVPNLSQRTGQPRLMSARSGFRSATCVFEMSSVRRAVSPAS